MSGSVGKNYHEIFTGEQACKKEKKKASGAEWAILQLFMAHSWFRDVKVEGS